MNLIILVPFYPNLDLGSILLDPVISFLISNYFGSQNFSFKSLYAYRLQNGAFYCHNEPREVETRMQMFPAFFVQCQ